MAKYNIFEEFIPEEIKEKHDEEMAQVRAVLDASILISEALHEKNMSQNELAELIGVSKGYVSRLLSGSENVSLKNIARILHLLGKEIVIETKPVKPAEGKVVWADFTGKRAKVSVEEPVFNRNATDWIHATLRAAK